MPWPKGRPQSAEANARRSAALTGYQRTPEHQEKLNKSRRGRNFLEGRVAEDANGWKGTAAGYRAKHVRVERARGKARDHTCRCGAEARHWHCGGDYDNINDYVAVCVPCHKELDDDHHRTLLPA